MANMQALLALKACGVFASLWDMHLPQLVCLTNPHLLLLLGVIKEVVERVGDGSLVLGKINVLLSHPDERVVVRTLKLMNYLGAEQVSVQVFVNQSHIRNFNL